MYKISCLAEDLIAPQVRLCPLEFDTNDNTGLRICLEVCPTHHTLDLELDID
jgi:hypothetical protein